MHVHIFWEGGGALIYKTLIYKTGRLIAQTLVRACNVFTKNRLLNIVFTEMTFFNIQFGVKSKKALDHTKNIWTKAYFGIYIFYKTLLIMNKR